MSHERAERIADFIGPLRVEPGSKVRLDRDFDPRYKAGLKKRDGIELLRTGVSMLAEYQERLAAQDTYGVLLCLQALDAGGKDGTIRHVMSGVNPQGVRVSSFKVPSAEELDHDYLWRYAQRLPTRGEIAIFNRSHYEEVLVVRVHPENLVRQKLPDDTLGPGIWERRYREINHWERYLTDNGFKVVKIFLNLSKEEQRTRFLKRIDLPERNWKFSAADVRERRRWGRLPGRVLRDAVGHEYEVGTVVRRAGGPEVVRADLRGGGPRARPDGHRSSVPRGGGRGAERAARRQTGVGAGSPRGGPGRSVHLPASVGLPSHRPADEEDKDEGKD
jgi:PPK2 family polyphosphate:nucleotide phosphotransferase